MKSLAGALCQDWYYNKILAGFHCNSKLVLNVCPLPSFSFMLNVTTTWRAGILKIRTHRLEAPSLRFAPVCSPVQPKEERKKKEKRKKHYW